MLSKREANLSVLDVGVEASKSVESFARRTVCDPVFIRRCIKYFITNRHSCTLSSISESRVADALRIIGLYSSRGESSDPDVRGLVSEASNAIDQLGSGLAGVNSINEENVDEIITVLVSRLYTVSQSLERHNIYEKDDTTVDNDEVQLLQTRAGGRSRRNCDLVASTLLTKLLGEYIVACGESKSDINTIDDGKVIWDPERCKDTFECDIVIHAVNLLRGPTRFDMIMSEKFNDIFEGLSIVRGRMRNQTSTALPETASYHSQVYTCLFEHSSMAIPQYIILEGESDDTESALSAMKELSRNSGTLWDRSHVRSQSVDISGERTGFRCTHILKSRYRKDVWIIEYLRVLAQMCSVADSLGKMVIIREWIYQFAHLISIAIGLSKKVLDFNLRELSYRLLEWNPWRPIDGTTIRFAEIAIESIEPQDCLRSLLEFLDEIEIFPYKLLVTEATYMDRNAEFIRANQPETSHLIQPTEFSLNSAQISIAQKNWTLVTRVITLYLEVYWSHHAEPSV